MLILYFSDFQRNLMEKKMQPKHSKDLLNLRKIQETMARAKDYTEAHKLKLKADALEAWELGTTTIVLFLYKFI
jgi:hypothetical protein